MIATMGSLSAKRKIRHFAAVGFRAVQACDGRSIDAITVSATDPQYTTCTRCAKLVEPTPAASKNYELTAEIKLSANGFADADTLAAAIAFVRTELQTRGIVVNGIGTGRNVAITDLHVSSVRDEDGNEVAVEQYA